MKSIRTQLALALLTPILSGCGKEAPKQLEFLVEFCETKTNECEEPVLWKIRVRKFENTVLINEFDKNGFPTNNHFLPDCKILDQNNWKCGALSMIEGQLVDQYEGSEAFFKYKKRK